MSLKIRPLFRASLLLFLCLTASTSGSRAEEPPFEREENAVYTLRDGLGLVMDVFTPKGEKNGLGIIDTLSGAWYSEQGQVNDHMKGKIFHTYCSRGYKVFMVRPGSRTRFTAQEMVENLKTAIRFVKSRADYYGINPERLGLTGASAGGHLSLLTAALSERGDWEADDPVLREGTRVRAVAVFFPPTDFLDWNGNPVSFDRIENILFNCGIGGMGDEEILTMARKISPAHQAKRGFPPTLLIHGDADERVPLQQSERMVEALQAVGASVQLIVKEGGGHPWPTISEEVVLMADWFDDKLGLN